MTPPAASLPTLADRPDAMRRRWLCAALLAAPSARAAIKGGEAGPDATDRGGEAPTRRATVLAPSPEFALSDLAGRVHSLRATAQAHRVTVLNFWATWCAPCVKELPEFDEVLRGFQAAQVPVALLAANALEPADKVRAFSARMKLSFPLLLDPDGDALGAYPGFSGSLPMTFLIDQHGVLRQRIAAPLSGAGLRERVQALLAAQAR